MPAMRQLAIPIPHEEIAEFCRKWGIRKLDDLSRILGGRTIDMGTFNSLSRWIRRDVLNEAVEEYVEEG